MTKILSPIILSLLATSAIAQVPCFSTNFGANLGLTDDSFAPIMPLGFTFTYGGVPYTDVQICSNGFIVFGTGAPGAADYTPTVLELVNNPTPRVCPLWKDFNPGAAGSGGVYANAVPAAGATPAHFVVTWDGVFQFGTSIAQSMQITFIDGGLLQIAYGTNLAAGTNPWLIGASPGNGAAQNAVSFATLPIATAGNATLHETGTGAGSIPTSGDNLGWTPDGLGGYVITMTANCASSSTYGSGCVAGYASFYEHFQTTPSIDLSNSAYTMLNTGLAYLVLQSTQAFVPPSGTATNLALGDDAATTITLSGAFPYPGGTTTTLSVCSNGHVDVAPNGNDYTPTPAEMLAWPNTAWAVWRDFYPTAAGADNVYFEEVGGIAYVTWLNVLGYVGTALGVTPSTFQFQFDLVTGNVHVVFLSMDTVSVSGWTGGEGWVVGYSPAGPSANPGSVDLSVVLPGSIVLNSADTLPLALGATGMPTPGSTVSLDVTNIPAGAPFGAVVFGLTQFNPGIPLAGIGMPGCFQYNDALSVSLFFGPVGSGSVPFGVPPGPGFIGVHIHCQGAAYAAGSTPLGFITSNGVDLGIGN